jgi:hypothetical protein
MQNISYAFNLRKEKLLFFLFSEPSLLLKKDTLVALSEFQCNILPLNV